jgi:hypothetical protein
MPARRPTTATRNRFDSFLSQKRRRCSLNLLLAQDPAITRDNGAKSARAALNKLMFILRADAHFARIRRRKTRTYVIHRTEGRSRENPKPALPNELCQPRFFGRRVRAEKCPHHKT